MHYRYHLVLLLVILSLVTPSFLAFRTQANAAPEECTQYDPSKISIPVLMYHYISPGPAQEYWTTSYEEFQRQMKWFYDNGFSAITVDELHEFMTTGEIKNPRSFLPIFDDNWYTSIKERVLPTMRQYGFKATLALYTDGVYTQGKNVFTWSELRRWESAGLVDVQAHSISHPLSPALNQLSGAQMWREIFVSKFLIEHHLKKNVSGFIAPGGSVSGLVKFLTRIAGYKTFYLLWEDSGAQYGDDPLSIYRVNMVRTLSFDGFIQKMERYSTAPSSEDLCINSKFFSLLDDNTVLAYYGHPLTPALGILGEYSPEDLKQIIWAKMQEYDDANGDKGVIGAFHIIFGLSHPDGSVTTLDKEILMRYIRFAKKNNMIVILDHQIGAGSVASAIRDMLPYLKYDNVHLAIDPEWHTELPGSRIGSVSGAEINNAQKLIQEYLEARDIHQKKMLIVHQFNAGMISQRDVVRSDFSLVDLVHDADGFGTPNVKKSEYSYNARADNIPLKGIKLFLPGLRRSWGYDSPLMSPRGIMDLIPMPSVVIYQ